MKLFPESIRKTFSMALLGLSLLITAFMLLLVLSEQRQASLSAATSMRNAVDLQVSYLDRWFRLNIMEDIRALAGLSSVRARDLERIAEDFDAAVRGRTDIADLYYADPEGMVLVQSGVGVLRYSDLSVSDRGYFDTAKKGKEEISPVLIGKISGEEIIVFSVPSMRDDVLEGVVIGAVRLYHFGNLIKRQKFGASGKFILFDGTGRAIGGESAKNDPCFDPEEVRLSGETTVDTRDDSGHRCLMYVRPVEHGGLFVGGQVDMEEIRSGSLRMAMATIAIAIILGVIGMGTFALISRKVNGYLADLKSEISSLSDGDYSPIPKENLKRLPLELREIAEGIDALKGSIKGSIDTIREQGVRDSLTGLHNRRFFEEKLRFFATGENDPITVAICDVNGLKLINDGMGHVWGDRLIKKAAATLSEIAAPDDIVARLGGDEFAIVSPNGDENTPDRLDRAFHERLDGVESGEDVPLYMAWGIAQGNAAQRSLEEIAKDADDRMYALKELQRNNARSGILSFFLRYIRARENRRVCHMDNCRAIMEDFLRGEPDVDGLFRKKMARLASIHDIGLIGVSPEVIGKTGPLSRDDKKAVRSHSEIGYRIAFAVPYLSDLAEAILHHHQRWDGRGYPFRDTPVAGEDIPLESRIMNLVDSYEAMTNRSYGPPITHEAAIAEIKRCSGTQFDPAWAERFISFLETRNTGIQN